MTGRLAFLRPPCMACLERPPHRANPRPRRSDRRRMTGSRIASAVGLAIAGWARWQRSSGNPHGLPEAPDRLAPMDELTPADVISAP